MEPALGVPLEAAKALEIARSDGRRRLHLDANDPPRSVFKHQVDLLAASCPVMKRRRTRVTPTSLLDDLCDDEGL